MPAYEGDPKSYPVNDLNANGMIGTCLCKAIKITLTQRDLFKKPNGHICHCLNCRRATGSNAWSLLFLPTENIRIEDPQGYMKNYADGETSTGKAIQRSFCSNCGSTLGNIPTEGNRASHTAIALGLFPRMPTPEFELFSAHKQEWLPPAVPEDQQYEYRPPMMDKY